MVFENHRQDFWKLVAGVNVVMIVLVPLKTLQRSRTVPRIYELKGDK